MTHEKEKGNDVTEASLKSLQLEKEAKELDKMIAFRQQLIDQFKEEKEWFTELQS